MIITAALIPLVAATLVSAKKQTNKAPAPAPKPSRPTVDDYIREQQMALAKTNAMIAEERERTRQKKQAIADAKLRFDMMMSEFDIEHLSVTLEDLNESFEKATADALKYHHAGDARREEQAKNRVMVQRNKIHAAQKNLAKAEFARRVAAYQLDEGAI